jgi:hypothetical protein
MVEELREQMIQEEALELEEARRRSAQPLFGLEPRQRLILALLLFFDVALCGCMALVMMGRIMPPF